MIRENMVWSYPFDYFKSLEKNRLYELLSIKINNGLSKEERKELDLLIQQHWFR